MSERFTHVEDGHEAELTYSIEGDRMTLLHTGVPEELGGRGIGGALVEQAVAKARSEGLTIVPTCSYARSWIEKHQDAVEGVSVATV
jgi:uncharacterized protein